MSWFNWLNQPATSGDVWGVGIVIAMLLSGLAKYLEREFRRVLNTVTNISNRLPGG
jgi:hypothetical protein